MMIMDQLIHTIILYSDGEAVCKIIGRMIYITVIYGDEQEMLITNGIAEMIGQRGSDHVQHDIMFLVKKNGMIC